GGWAGAKGAGSEWVKYGASRQAATANSRSSVSPAFLALRAPESTHALQPLIWLVRRWTSSSVAGGTPPCSVALNRRWMACIASGRTIAGLVIRGCMISLLIDCRACPGLCASMRGGVDTSAMHPRWAPDAHAGRLPREALQPRARPRHEGA